MSATCSPRFSPLIEQIARLAQADAIAVLVTSPVSDGPKTNMFRGSLPVRESLPSEFTIQSVGRVKSSAFAPIDSSLVLSPTHMSENPCRSKSCSKQAGRVIPVLEGLTRNCMLKGNNAGGVQQGA